MTGWTVHGTITRVFVTVTGLPATAPASITMCPMCVTAARPLGFDDTIVESSGGALPETFDRVSHVVSGSNAFQASDPPPELLIRIAEVFDAVLPRNAVSGFELDVTDNCGGGVIVNVTVICAGLTVAPADVTVTWPVCVPDASPAGLSVTVIDPAPVPPPGTALSHVVSGVAVQLSVPPPVFVTFRVFVFLAVSPC